MNKHWTKKRPPACLSPISLCSSWLLVPVSVWPVETSLLSMAGHCHLSLCSCFLFLYSTPKLIQSMRMARGRFVQQHCWLTSTWRSGAGFSLLIAKETKSLCGCVPRCLIMINDQGCWGRETRTKQLSLCSSGQGSGFGFSLCFFRVIVRLIFCLWLYPCFHQWTTTSVSNTVML